MTTATGRVVRGDALVIATGLRPRTLPDQDELAGVHVLRTLDDAVALRRDLAAGRRLVVVAKARVRPLRVEQCLRSLAAVDDLGEERTPGSG